MVGNNIIMRNSKTLIYFLYDILKTIASITVRMYVDV